MLYPNFSCGACGQTWTDTQTSLLLLTSHSSAGPSSNPHPQHSSTKKIPNTTGISHSLLKASSSLSSTGLGSSLISYEYLYTATCNKLQLAAASASNTEVCPRVWLSKVDLMAEITTFSPLLFLATELPAQLAATLNICAFPKCSGSHRWD